MKDTNTQHNFYSPFLRPETFNAFFLKYFSIFGIKSYFCDIKNSKMKKIASILLIIFALMSCSQEITRNNPSVQGLKDGVLWRANHSYAVRTTSGVLTITGLTQYETLTLTTNWFEPGTYTLGTNIPNTAAYEFAKDGTTLNYTTGPNIGDGEIKIEEWDDINQTITGKFRFNAQIVGSNPEGNEVLNFIEGHFYKIPVTSSAF